MSTEHKLSVPVQLRFERTPDQIVGPYYPLTKPLDRGADLTTSAYELGTSEPTIKAHRHAVMISRAARVGPSVSIQI